MLGFLINFLKLATWTYDKFNYHQNILEKFNYLYF